MSAELSLNQFLFLGPISDGRPRLPGPPTNYIAQPETASVADMPRERSVDI
jgi:hypothetical protein